MVKPFSQAEDAEIFTYSDEETGEKTIWSINRANKLVARLLEEAWRTGVPSTVLIASTVPLDQKTHDYIVRQRNIEERRVAAITAERAAIPLLAFFQGRMATIFDGNHRMVWRFRHGFSYADVIAIPKELLDEECAVQLPAAIEAHLFEAVRG